MADANGQVTSARSHQAITPIQLQTDIRIEGPDEQPPSATLDVIRPPFARNNTSVLIINETNPDMPNDGVESVTAPPIVNDDDAITLGDIPLLADQTIRHRGPPGGRPLLASLSSLQLLILKHFALLQLQKTGIGHLIELDEVLELLEIRKSQWWNKIFKGNAKKDQKKKGESSRDKQEWYVANACAIGVFGVPIEVLVERTGSDSQQGTSNDQLRVPEFIEDIISTMRQMGE
jgi:hypothetical protein